MSPDMPDPDRVPLEPIDRVEMVVLQRHAYLASYLVANLQNHGLTESQIDQCLYGWSNAWWEQHRN